MSRKFLQLFALMLLSISAIGQNSVPTPIIGTAVPGAVPTAGVNGVSTYQLPAQPGSQNTNSGVATGCGVEYTGTGLVYTVGVCNYTINGQPYSIASLSTVTLPAADPSNPEIDSIIVDNTGTASAIAGTPATNPQNPTVDSSTQLALTFVLVPATATTPSNTTVVNIYQEGTEWTGAVGGTNSARVNLTSTNNPYQGTHDTEFGTSGTVTTTTFAGWTVPSSGTVTLSNYNTLTFYLRNKAAWVAKRSISIQFFSGATPLGIAVPIGNNSYGLNTVSNFTTYQQVSIPVSSFGIPGVTATSMRVTVTGSGAALTGFYIDDVTLQGGTGSVTLPTTLMNWKGVYSTTATYNPNDEVVSSAGIGYVALVQNTNVALSTTSTWQPLASISGLCPTCLLGTLGAGVVHAPGSSQTMTSSKVNLATEVTGSLPNANLANPSTTVNGQTCTLGSTCTIALPLVLSWTFNSGAPATDAAPRFLASRAGTISNCYVLTTASDGSTGLAFNVFDNGSQIITGSPTVGAGTSAGTLTTFSSLSVTSIANNDNISVNITGGTSAWIFTVQCK